MKSLLRSSLILISVLLAAALALTACGTSKKSTSAGGASTSGGSAARTSSDSPSASPSPVPTPAGTPVRVSTSLQADGSVWGVGMPIMLKFDVAPGSSEEFTKNTTVTVNGQPATGAWYFFSSGSFPGAVMEARYREQNYWPANAKISMVAKIKDKSAGSGLYFANDLSLDFSTSDARVSVVDASTLQMTVTLNGAPWGTFPVSLGAAKTPTSAGTKVIMEKGAVVRMTGPGYDECCVKWTQRLTYGGEYLHAAPWNIANLGKRSTSNGCTNLSPADAQKLYNFLQQGDPVEYPNANGPAMRIGDGIGDWSIPWSSYQTGGALVNHGT